MHQNITPHHTHPKDPLLRSLVGSVAVGMPSLFMVVWLIRNSPILEQPSLIAMVILGMAAANFMALVQLERRREDLGRLTLHAMVLTVGMVLLYVFADAFNRFVVDVGYRWLYPPVLATLAVVYLALFRERHFWIKTLLAVNGITLASLWCLGVAEKLALPF
ncbi:MAG TPA: hypothetical protein PLW48_00180 [Alphaproteobacteria bacterium]|nr:hypothetical protein [Alphaproteobacteria bacterium]HCS23609.1 hypothetical protein [Rhodospirillaceae bacterium]HRI77771.1 hypothetical protein [Alphaproteobacteria bacterium]HRJ65525.1 hypothetical protein [Alphaproteobacteria bacterium]